MVYLLYYFIINYYFGSSWVLTFEGHFFGFVAGYFEIIF
jgi:hypothetical protein